MAILNQRFHNSASVTRGGVYELQNRNGMTNGDLYVVVSSNEYCCKMNKTIVCLIKAAADIEDPEYCVPFVMKQVNLYTDMYILAGNVLNVRPSNLVKYKFTLTDDVMDKVSKMISCVITGKMLYTLDEAIVELHNKEVTQRIEYEASLKTGIVSAHGPVVEVPVDDTDYDMLLDDENLTTEDAQLLFAKSMKGEKFDFNAQEIKEEPVNSTDIDEGEIEDTDENDNGGSEKALDVIEPNEEKKENAPRQKYNKRPSKEMKEIYKHVYENYEEYLMDYYTNPIEFVSKKWGMDHIQCQNRAIQCRTISKRNGDDQSMWDEAQKAHIKESISIGLKKNKSPKATSKPSNKKTKSTRVICVNDKTKNKNKSKVYK